MNFKSLRFIALALVYSGLQSLTAVDQAQSPSLVQTIAAAEQMSDVKARTEAPKKIVLIGIEEVLVFGDPSKVTGGKFGNFLGFTTEKVKKELFDALYNIHVPNFRPLGIYPPLIEAWLLGFLSNQQVHDIAYRHIKKHYSFMKKIRLETAVDIAFSDKQARTFSPYSDSIALAHSCKSAGCIIALCTSWNKESFDNLMRVQASLLGFFDTSYVSGYCGLLAAVLEFYNPIIEKYGIDNIVLVDSQPENIRAAKKRGIKTISFTSAAAAERELRAMRFLS